MFIEMGHNNHISFAYFDLRCHIVVLFVVEEYVKTYNAFCHPTRFTNKYSGLTNRGLFLYPNCSSTSIYYVAYDTRNVNHFKVNC